MNDEALPFQIALEDLNKLKQPPPIQNPPGTFDQVFELYDTVIRTSCLAESQQNLYLLALDLFVKAVAASEIVIDSRLVSDEVWKEYEGVPIKYRALSFLQSFLRVDAVMKPLLTMSNEELGKVQQLFEKVEYPKRVTSFTEGKEIARQVHRYTALLSQNLLIWLYHYLFEERFHFLKKHAGKELSGEKALAFVEDNPLLKEILQGIGGCMLIDLKLEFLQWSDRAEWPAIEEPPSTDDIQRELRKEVASLAEEQGLQVPETLESYIERHEMELHEVETAIEEVEEFGWEGRLGVKRPLAYETFRKRLLRYQNLLSIRKRLLRRLSREYLGGIFQATSPWDKQETPQQQSPQRGTVEERAATVFEGKSRPPGEGTQIPSDVRAWAVEAFHTFCREGHSREEAKDGVLGLAEKHNYHFSRRWLQQQIKEQSGS